MTTPAYCTIPKAGATRQEVVADIFVAFCDSDWPEDRFILGQDIIDAFHAAGLKIMARQPTKKMSEAAQKIGAGTADKTWSVWTDEDTFRAMWDAAP